MARVNIDDDFFTEGKLRILSNSLPRFIPTKEDAALGIMVRLWRNSQAELKVFGSKKDIIDWCEVPKKYASEIFDALLSCDRIIDVESGPMSSRYEVVGNRKHVDKLSALKANAKQGGLKLQEKVRFSEANAKPNAKPIGSNLLSPITITNTITNKKEDKIVNSDESTPLPSVIKKYPVREFFELWNSTASEKLPRINIEQIKPTSKRYVRAKSRLIENPDLEYWKSVILKLNESSFCTGDNNRGWRASFDFIIQSDTHNKIMEGGYNGQARQKQTGIIGWE